MPNDSFRSRWLERFELPECGWFEGFEKRLAERPFCNPKEAKALLCFLFDKLPGILEKDTSPETRLLAEAFAWTCFAFWQCGSAFPSFPENYADCLRKALGQSPDKRPVVAKAIAGLIVSENGTSDGRCGFNQLSLSDPGFIRESERLIHAGRYEEYLKAAEKYGEYEDALSRSPEFQADWHRIRTAFPKQTQDLQAIENDRPRGLPADQTLTGVIPATHRHTTITPK